MAATLRCTIVLYIILYRIDNFKKGPDQKSKERMSEPWTEPWTAVVVVVVVWPVLAVSYFENNLLINTESSNNGVMMQWANTGHRSGWPGWTGDVK